MCASTIPGLHLPEVDDDASPRRALMMRAGLLLAVLAITGCASIGPATVARDRFDYMGAVSESWKSQMLLNLVKIRYGDAPVFLDIGQIVAGYQLYGSITVDANASTFDGGAAPHAITGGFGGTAGGVYSDNPTVTYAPMAGEAFARSLMTPIPPSAILNVVQAGYPVDAVFQFGVQSVNGVDNRRVGFQQVKPADPTFYALLQSLRRIQDAGDIGVRTERSAKDETLDIVIRPRLSAVVESAALNVSDILGLDPTARDFRVVYGAVATNDREIAILSRSMLEVLTDLASSIVVPENHVAEHRVAPTPEFDRGPDGPIPPLIRITSSPDRPRDAYAAVPYRGSWFWIDDRDLRSKNFFSFIMFLFTFVQTGAKDAAPVLTIPTR